MKAGRILVLFCAALPAQPPAKPSLRGLSAVNATIAWAGGTQGTLLRTSDAGRSWQSVGPANTAALDFRDIEAFDADTAYALSAGPAGASRLYFTRDAGGAWTQLAANSHPNGFWDAIAFWNPNRGLLLGDPIDGAFDIRITHDGGRTWTQPLNPVPARPNEAAFAASGTCLITGPRGRAWFVTGGSGGGRIFASRDWGKTWRASDLPIAHPAASTGAFSVAFDGARDAVVVGGDFQKPVEASAHVAYSSDGGRTWRLAEGSKHFLSAVRKAGGSWIATGPAGAEVSHDGGRTWATDSETGYHSLAVARDGSVWASGADGRAALYRPMR